MQLRGMPYVAGSAQGRLQWGLSDDCAGRIVVLGQNDLRPLASPPAGLIVVDGAPFAHAMIPLLARGIPTVIIDAQEAAALRSIDQVGVDGDRGLISTEPAQIPSLPKALPSGCVTRDGVGISLRVSARDLAAVKRAAETGAEAIGLVRSEFLLPPDGSRPDVEFYRQGFRELCQAADPLPVSIRLLDIAADKLPLWLPRLEGTGGALGLQGVRLFEREPIRSVYQAQLTAIDALSESFDIRVLIPYVGSLAELCVWSKRVRSRLDRPLLLGAMAETPAAALALPEWFEQVAFVGLGCNDLMQCLFGADRAEPELRRYLDPYAPVLYRFLRQVAGAASEHLDRLQLCGVLPQLPGILPLLLGLGFRVFSVEAASLDYMNRTVAMTDLGEAAELARRVCGAHDSDQVRALLA